MKKTIGLITFSLAIAIAALPAFGQQQPATPAPAAAPAQGQCTPENKLALYNDFRTNFKTDTAKANELAKKWLACPEVAGEEQITPYLKNFVTLYEKANRKDRVHELVYAKKDYPKAFELGKQVLADEPENLRVLIDLAYAGWDSKGETYTADTLAYARKAIQLIESGKAPDAWLPYTSKDEALGYLNYALGTRTMGKSPAEALPFLIKAAQFEGKIKKLPLTYALIAGAYNDGPYAAMSADYQTRFKDKNETPESKLALENINQVMDRMIDALARAVALAGNDAANQANKKAWMDTLTGWYKFRHNDTDTGLNDMIAGILTKPLPPEPTLLTTLPAAAPAGSPTSGTVSATGTVATGTTTVSPAGTTTTPAANAAPKTTTPATAPKPNGAAKTTPAAPKPKPKRNHSGRH